MRSRSAAVLALSLGVAPVAFAQNPPASAVPAPAPRAASPVVVPLRTDPIAPAVPFTGGYGAASSAPCAPADCGPEPCGPPGRVWANAEWLYWATSGQPLPPLATTAPVGTPQAAAGTLGTPTTAVLFGGRRENDEFRNGLRITGGFWLNDDRTFGLEGDFFFFGRSRDGFAAGSNGSQIISRPFFNALTGLPDVELVSFPGVLAGTLTVDARSNVIGGGVNAVHNLCCNPCGRVDLLYGYRYFHLDDEVTIREDLTALGGATRVPPDFRFQITDRFRTDNDFHGGLIGLAAERRFASMFVSLRASVALGATEQRTEIDGTTVSIPPGGVGQVATGGLLAQPTNIGRYERSEFAVMPEIGVRAGCQLTETARVYAGYTFLYLSDVARAGDQIDSRVNPNLLPPRAVVGGPAVPAFTPRTTDFWLQGVSAGVQLRF